MKKIKSTVKQIHKEINTPSIHFYENSLQKSRVLRNFVGVINFSKRYVTIIKLPFLYEYI